MTEENVTEETLANLGLVVSLLYTKRYSKLIELIEDGALVEENFVGNRFPFDAILTHASHGDDRDIEACMIILNKLLDRGMKPRKDILDRAVNEVVILDIHTLHALIYKGRIQFKNIGLLTKFSFRDNAYIFFNFLLACGVDANEVNANGLTAWEQIHLNSESDQYNYKEYCAILIAYGAQSPDQPWARVSVDFLKFGAKSGVQIVEDLQKKEFSRRAKDICIALSRRKLPILVTMFILEATIEIARFTSWSYRWNFVATVVQELDK